MQRNRTELKALIRIGLLVSGAPPTTIGGTEIATQKIAQLLSERHFDVQVITRNVQITLKGKKRSLQKFELYKGYAIHRIPCSKIPVFRFITHVIFGCIKLIQIKPDIIHAQQLTPNGIIAVIGGAILRKKTLVWAQGSEIYNSSLPYLKSLGGFVVSHTTIVLALSNHMQQKMQQIWSKKPIFQLSTGIDLNKYFHDSTPKNKKEIIYVGRLIKSKRVTDALKTIANVKDAFPKMALTIIGSGPEERNLKKESLSLNIREIVRFLGQKSPNKISKYLSKADLFIFPSSREGFPNAVLEAMASGLPVLAARISVMPELVRNNINGLLHAPGNIDELTANLKTILQNDDLRTSMGLKSREFAQKYGWEKTITELIKFYFNE